MFQHKDPGSTKSTVWYFTFRIFYAHILSIVITVGLAVLLSLIQESIGFGDMVLTLIVNIVTFIVYVYLVYRDSWGIGQHDHNRVLYEHETYDHLKPLKASLLSQIPGLILAVWLLIAPDSLRAFQLANFFYANFRFPIMLMWNAGLRFTYLIPWVFAVAFALWGYRFGYIQKRVTDKVRFTRGSIKK